MGFLTPDQVNGEVVKMLRTDPRHMSPEPQFGKTNTTAEESFGRLLFKALNQVNADQVDSINLTEKMITDPDSVNIHDVTIAIAKANLSLSITKAIADRAIRAYREIINVR